MKHFIDSLRHSIWIHQHSSCEFSIPYRKHISHWALKCDPAILWHLPMRFICRWLSTTLDFSPPFFGCEVHVIFWARTSLGWNNNHNSHSREETRLAIELNPIAELHWGLFVSVVVFWLSLAQILLSPVAKLARPWYKNTKYLFHFLRASYLLRFWYN